MYLVAETTLYILALDSIWSCYPLLPHRHGKGDSREHQSLPVLSFSLTACVLLSGSQTHIFCVHFTAIFDKLQMCEIADHAPLDSFLKGFSFLGRQEPGRYCVTHIVYRVFPFTAANTDNKSVIDNTTPYLSSRSRCCRRYRV